MENSPAALSAQGAPFAASPAAIAPPVPPGYKFTFTERERRACRPREQLTVSEWAARHRIVIEGDRTGRWTNEYTPYLQEPMDLFASPTVRRIVLCFAPQTAKTQMGLNCLAWAADQDPGPAFYVMPSQDGCRRLSKERMIPTWRASPRIASLLSSEPDDVSTFSIRFAGMRVIMAWAGSSSSLSSDPARYVIFDEVDEYELSGSAADPLDLGEDRTRSYPFTKKIVFYSKPGLEGQAMDRLMTIEADEVRDYWVPCPICGHEQIMKWDNFTWPDKISDARIIKRRRLARYSCKRCGMKWDDRLRNAAVRDPRARWRPREEADNPITVAFHLPSWYSPVVSLSDVVADYVAGLSSPRKMRHFVNSHKAESYKETVVQTQSSRLEANVIDLPRLICPPGTVAVTAFIDPGKDRYWYTCLAWLRDMTAHVIDYGELKRWSEVTALVHETFYPVDGAEGDELGVWRAGVDTGGGRKDGNETMTEAAYDWIRLHGAGKVVGTKGMSSKNRSGRKIHRTILDKTPKGRPIPQGIDLWTVDTEAFKDAVHYRMGIDEGSAGRLTFHKDTTEEFFRHIAAEEKQRDKKGRVAWVLVGKANHWFDCLVGNFVLADPEAKGGVRVRSQGRPGAAAPAMPAGRRIISPGIVR